MWFQASHLTSLDIVSKILWFLACFPLYICLSNAKEATWHCSTGHEAFKLTFSLNQQKRLVMTLMKEPKRVKCEKATASLLVDRIFFPLMWNPGNSLFKKEEGERITWRISKYKPFVKLSIWKHTWSLNIRLKLVGNPPQQDWVIRWLLCLVCSYAKKGSSRLPSCVHFVATMGSTYNIIQSP